MIIPKLILSWLDIACQNGMSLPTLYSTAYAISCLLAGFVLIHAEMLLHPVQRIQESRKLKRQNKFGKSVFEIQMD